MHELVSYPNTENDRNSQHSTIKRKMPIQRILMWQNLSKIDPVIVS